MSRIRDDFDYMDAEQQARVNLWRGNLHRQIRSKRGQAFLKELLAAIEVLPDKRLASGVIAKPDGPVCSLGAMALARRIASGEDPRLVLDELSSIIVDDSDERWKGEEIEEWAKQELACPSHLAWEIPFVNDYGSFHSETPESRYERMVAWTRAKIL